MTFPSLPYKRLSASVLSKQTAFLNKLLGKWKKNPNQNYMSFSFLVLSQHEELLYLFIYYYLNEFL